MLTNHTCPSCGTTGMSIFYELSNVPVHSVLLLSSPEQAVNLPRRDIKLGFCHSCGFISNVVFDASVHDYSSKYEATQGFSPTFNSFHRDLAIRLIERYDLHNKDIIEIGCGQGEFLTLLCEIGGNRGIGIDPAYDNEKRTDQAYQPINFIKDFYSEKYKDLQCDFVCCKMTLEHIQQTADFVSAIRRSLGDKSNTVVFFQVPDVRRILQELAFWDIYYEHCSYFSEESLSRLFIKCRFAVIDLWKDYEAQYLMIAARPGNGQDRAGMLQEKNLQDLTRDVAYFAENFTQRLDVWKWRLQKIEQSGRRAVIWGAASKAVAFLTTLKIRSQIEYAVDINPHKHGTYLAGTGQKIVAPEFLREYKPDLVIVMNPIYCDEIHQQLNKMGIDSEVMTV